VKQEKDIYERIKFKTGINRLRRMIAHTRVKKQQLTDILNFRYPKFSIFFYIVTIFIHSF